MIFLQLTESASQLSRLEMRIKLNALDATKIPTFNVTSSNRNAQETPYSAFKRNTWGKIHNKLLVGLSIQVSFEDDYLKATLLD